ncbi:hypothetical protein ACHAXR_000557, partial [Thalassiosira sp. AJA248-18]
MTTLTASSNSDSNGGRGSGTSAWPSMERPPADDAKDRQHDSTTPAIMNYVSRESTEISTRRDLGGSDDALIGAIWDPTVVRVADARRLLGSDNEMTLNVNGFELKTWSKSEEEEQDQMTLIREMDFCDQDRVVEDYYPTCERIVSEAASESSCPSTPIACVCAFDHNVRSSDRASVGEIKSKQNESNVEGGEAAAAAPQVQNPAGIVHADYTITSAPRRLQDLSNPPKLNDVL